MSKGLEDAASRGDGYLWHRDIPGIGEELGQVRRLGLLVGRLGIVVRSVIGMSPFVDALWHRLDELDE